MGLDNSGYNVISLPHLIQPLHYLGRQGMIPHYDDLNRLSPQIQQLGTTYDWHRNKVRNAA